MPTDADLILFLTASLVVIVAPGPDNILVLTCGVTLGRRAALVSAMGASVGLVTHSLFAAAGLSALLAQSAAAFSVVKYAGAAYLIFLGVRALLDRKSLVLAEGVPPVGLRSVFTQAVASNVLNPKIAVFFLAYLPQFADPSAGGMGSSPLTWCIWGDPSLRLGQAAMACRVCSAVTSSVVVPSALSRSARPFWPAPQFELGQTNAGRPSSVEFY